MDISNKMIVVLIAILALVWWYHDLNQVHISSANETKLGQKWENAVRQQKPIIVYFYMDGCHSCESFNPIITNLAEEFKAQYTFITAKWGVPEDTALRVAFRVGTLPDISAFPSLYLVDPKTYKFSMVRRYDQPEAIKEQLNEFLTTRTIKDSFTINNVTYQ